MHRWVRLCNMVILHKSPTRNSWSGLIKRTSKMMESLAMSHWRSQSRWPRLSISRKRLIFRIRWWHIMRSLKEMLAAVSEAQSLTSSKSSNRQLDRNQDPYQAPKPRLIPKARPWVAKAVTKKIASWTPVRSRKHPRPIPRAARRGSRRTQSRARTSSSWIFISPATAARTSSSCRAWRLNIQTRSSSNRKTSRPNLKKIQRRGQDRINLVLQIGPIYQATKGTQLAITINMAKSQSRGELGRVSQRRRIKTSPLRLSKILTTTITSSTTHK